MTAIEVVAAIHRFITAKAAIIRDDGTVPTASTLGLEVAMNRQTFAEISYAMALSDYGVVCSERRPVYVSTARELAAYWMPLGTARSGHVHSGN